MVSKNKGKELPDEDNQDREWKEEDKSVKEEDEEEVEEDSRAHPRATIASIKVVDNPFSANKSARIRTGARILLEKAPSGCNISEDQLWKEVIPKILITFL